jgi:hypothetical protein
MVILPILNNSWFCDEIIFYSSSASSNPEAITNITNNTWMPLIDIITDKNRQKYLELTKNQENIDNLNKPEYFLKMQFMKSINSTNSKQVFYFKSLVDLFNAYYKYELEMLGLVVVIDNKNVLQLDKNDETNLSADKVADCLEKIKILREQKLWSVINIYFSDVWQIVYSIYLNPDAELWTLHPSFRDFIRNQFESPSFINQFKTIINTTNTTKKTKKRKLSPDDFQVKGCHNFPEFANKQEMVVVSKHLLQDIFTRLNTLKTLLRYKK